jgi:hypothetical protein
MKVTLLSILILLTSNLYSQTLEPNFDCESGTISANNDLKKGLFRFIYYGFHPPDMSNTFSTILEKNFGILVEYPGCRAFPNYDCYNKVMMKAIEERFGTQLFDSIQQISYFLDSSGLGDRPPLFDIDDFWDYASLDSFIYCNLDFSKIDYDTADHPKIKVKFIVGKDGQLSNFKITDSASNKCNIEALRVVKMMPRWLHATRDGLPIEDYAIIEIIFSTRKKRQHCP